MQLNRFDLNLLIALDALIHEKNVTRAAERVFVSQPAMSAALQKLRDYFNDPLLVRVGRDMQLTPRGLSLVEPVREALLRIQVTLGTQPTFDPANVNRSFTVICSADAHLRVMPIALRRVVREAPGVQCHIEQFSETTLSRLEYGDADLYLGLNMLPVLGIRAFPDWLRVAEVRPVQWVGVVAADHPTVHEELTEEQFRTLPHLIGWPNSHSVPLEEYTRRLFNTEINVRATVQSLVEIPFLLQGTELIAALPERLAVKLSAVAPMKMFPLPLRMPETREVLVWHKRNEPDPGHAWLREILIEVAREP
ncbi:MAG TPA: LysR family transcriptional regulator [Steroidobacteraceae bacterium]|nr:LysR family transcriptional regulator [Steroidobacteraceae bacterium]